MKIVDLEAEILQFYRSRSITPMREFRKMMRDYRDMLITFRDGKKDSQRKKENFLVNLEKSFTFITPLHPDLKVYFHNHCPEYEKYFDVALLGIFPKETLLKNQTFLSNAFDVRNPPLFGMNDYLFNQVMIGEDPKKMRYNIGFSYLDSLTPSSPIQQGLIFEGFNLAARQSSIKTSDNPNFFIVDGFPEQSYIKEALFDASRKRIIKFSAKLD